MPEEFSVASREYAALALLAGIRPVVVDVEVQLFHMEPVANEPSTSTENGMRILTLSVGDYTHLPVPANRILVSADGLITMPTEEIFWAPIPMGETWSHIPTWARIQVHQPSSRILVDIDIQNLDMKPDANNKVRLVQNAFRLRPMPG